MMAPEKNRFEARGSENQEQGTRRTVHGAGHKIKAKGKGQKAKGKRKATRRTERKTRNSNLEIFSSVDLRDSFLPTCALCPVPCAESLRTCTSLLQFAISNPPPGRLRPSQLHEVTLAMIFTAPPNAPCGLRPKDKSFIGKKQALS